MLNNTNIKLSRELDICQVGAGNNDWNLLWSCYLFPVILITLSKQTKSWNLAGFGKNS